ncbi:MAG: hypothetical protein MUO77_07800 [Anaerolineales bacterium]|nr:hypothetical protein [Anaerolineales bacterium]
MKHKNTAIGLSAAALLLATLACRAITDIFSPPTATPPTLPPVTVMPSLEPTFTPVIPPASCPNITDQIMQIANAVSEESGTVGNNSRDEDAEIFLVTYIVSGDEINNPFYEDVSSDLQNQQDDTATHQDIWIYFTALIPAGQRQVLAEYSVMTDGEDNLLAAVSQTYDDPALWNLEVDIADVNDAYDLTYTLVHEFGHLLTLNPDQVPPSTAVFDNPDDENIYLEEVSACPDYFPGEGCAKPDSYINAFYNQFWPDIIGELQNINLEEGDDVYYQRLDNFYVKYQDQFVNDYAATNPEEDIAEAWTFFVFGPKPNGDTIAEEKVLFFYAYPELAQLREQILSNLCAFLPQ